MKLLKPSWVTHDGKPIFSVDIHPDGSRFATGGQGESSGKVAIWNMAPVRNQKDEMNENVPKMLCQMDNHLACVNCVRWSHTGRYLASAGDDKLTMIWQTSRQGGISTVFGSEVSVNVETWRCIYTLRGHHGDVLDLSWSAHDTWLATCSIDNTVIIWNAEKFPEQVAVLRGHTSMVKGVTWDPVGKYLASQSDDKSLRIWRTLDWQEEKCIKEPFTESGGTTHVLRLGWSPDGQFVVSAHAMNNAGPTAQIIERDGWKTNMDFVGHRKAITVVKFNPNIIRKKLKKNSEKLETFSCVAIGSRDRSITVWLTALKRPLVATHDLFRDSIMDISWSRCGKELLCCSWDGSVAYLGFTHEEIGRPLSEKEMNDFLKSVYGKSVSAGAAGGGNQIIESAELLQLHAKEEDRPKEAKPGPAPVPPVTPAKTPGMMNGGTPPEQRVNRQIETKTKDGRRRITPIFIESQPLVGETPLPFSSASNEPTFATSTERSQITVEMKDLLTPPVDGDKSMEPISVQTSSQEPTPPKLSPQTTKPFPTPGKDGGSPCSMPVLDRSSGKTSTPMHDNRLEDRDKSKLSVKRKLETSSPGDPIPVKKRGRPKKDRNLDTSQVSVTVPSSHTQATAAKLAPSVIYPTSSGLNLPVPSMGSSTSMQITGGVNSAASTVLELDNNLNAGSMSLHRIRCVKDTVASWEVLHGSQMLAVAGNSLLVCAACEDKSLHVYYAMSGQRVLPPLVLGSKVSNLRCCGHYVMVITSMGILFVWDTKSKSATIKNESLVGIIPTNDIKVERTLLTDQGLPIVCLSNGHSYTYRTELGTWVQMSSRHDTLHLCSDHHSCLTAGNDITRQTGIVAALQTNRQKSGSQAATLFRTNHTLQQPATLSHLQNQMSCCLSVKSVHEYKFWLMTYVRYITQEGFEGRIRELCDDLLGPLRKSKSQAAWENNILGLNKRELLAEILPLMGSNLQLQRLYVEYKEQLAEINAS